ncbi:MAG TPA: RnfH family protein [Burkholderiales bacterium]|nr:RnfH family protein [Burkholderiales bacterium]
MARLRVEVIRALPGRHERVTLELEEGATVATALQAAGLPAGDGVGIFGRRVALDRPLADGDRVELYRALRQDPREARRRRALRRKR